MNVYDFDNTIYDGESVVDFYFFLLKRDPGLIFVLPKVVYMLIKYKACKVSYEELMLVAEKYLARFLKHANSSIVSQFWDKNRHKIKDFYIKQHKDDDVVLSASCGFLIRGICGELGIKNVICSEIDEKSGKIVRVCYHDKKPEFFRNHFPDTRIDCFYTDSMNDAPMFGLANRVFLVKGKKVKELIV